MIIRSQNKARITDDLKLHICIHFYESTGECYEIRTSSGDAIGEYSTMEKAVKVLDMIQDTYVRDMIYCCVMSGTACTIAGYGKEVTEQAFETAGKVFVFEMPQDSEV